MVGRITVRTEDVFSPEEASWGWPFRAADALHVQTRPSVVRKFLLFRSGDPFDPGRLAESERNLRDQRFIKSASVRALPARGDTVDVEVVTQDTWSTEPALVLSRSGGTTTFGVSLLERNVLGTGRELELRYDEGVDRITRSFAFTDPNLLGPYWRGSVLHAENSDGREDQGGIRHPFSGLGARRSALLLYDLADRRERIYRSGEKASVYRRNHRAFQAEVGTALRTGPPRAVRLTPGLLYLHDRFSRIAARPGDVLPAGREHAYLTLRAESAANDLVKLRWVDRDARYQDFNLGTRVAGTLGISPAAFGLSRTTGLAVLEASTGLRLGAGTLLWNRLSASRRLGDRNANAILDDELRLVHRFGGRPPQTLVARLALDRGWDLDRDVQFFADGLTGLRGYTLRQYEGNKSVILNLEHRVFAGRELFQFLAPGAAVFFDAGAAAPEGAPLGLPGVHSDVGAGLRLALPRASVHDLFRLDVAWPLRPDRDGRRDLLISFSSSQAF